jgi:hypothetical protein
MVLDMYGASIAVAIVASRLRIVAMVMAVEAYL